MTAQALVRDGYSWAIDILPLKQPPVDYQLVFAFCEVANCGVELKVTVKGHFLYCIFDGKFAGCKHCSAKVREVTSFE